MAHEPILIVDDNPSNVKLARLLLTNAGFDVRTASDSREALEVLASFTPRLILMDIQLPGMDGLKLTRHLREHPVTRDSIIVAVTAYAMRGDEEKARAAGCNGYMCKPIDTRTFVSQIRQYLDKVAPNADSGDPNNLMRELRNEFLAEGLEASRRFAESDPAGDQLESMQRVAHHWAGMGGTLGFPEITDRARELEQMIELQPDRWRQQVPVGFTEMRQLFARHTGASVEEPGVPAELVKSLSSKQVGLVGFNPNEAARVRAAFDQVHATARDLGALSEGLGLDALRSHDLIVLNACTEEGVRSWHSVLAQPLLEKPVLLVSSRSALLDSKLALLDRAVDFVLEPWDAEELLCRAQRVVGQKPRAKQPHAQERQGPLVVLADDDAMIHSLLTPMLKKMGVEVHSARDGQQAMDAVRNLLPDALVLDIGMPRISGMSVLRELRRDPANRALQILMLSVRQQRNDISMALAFGATDYAVKPFDPEALVMRIMRLLPQPAASL